MNIIHDCRAKITSSLPHGGLYPWEFEKGGSELGVRVEGQLTYNTTAQRGCGWRPSKELAPFARGGWKLGDKAVSSRS